MTAHAIANKIRRALRNGTGASFTNEQLREVGKFGILHLLAHIEAEELCPATTVQAAIPTGPPVVAAAGRRSRRSYGPAEGQAYIEALTRPAHLTPATVAEAGNAYDQWVAEEERSGRRR